jgi:hypothetical protein
LIADLASIQTIVLDHTEAANMTSRLASHALSALTAALLVGHGTGALAGKG